MLYLNQIIDYDVRFIWIIGMCWVGLIVHMISNRMEISCNCQLDRILFYRSYRMILNCTRVHVVSCFVMILCVRVCVFFVWYHIQYGFLKMVTIFGEFMVNGRSYIIYIHTRWLCFRYSINVALPQNLVQAIYAQKKSHR